MPAGQPQGVRRARPERVPHHISSIAHLFFADGSDVDREAEPDANLDLAVTCLSDTSLAAGVCAGLVAASRAAGAGAQGWGVRLAEDPHQRWSAGSHLGPQETSRSDGGSVPAGGLSAWVWPHAVATRGWVRWANLGGMEDGDLASLEQLAGAEQTSPAEWRRPARRLGRHGVVACLLPEEVGRWGPALRLGRLLALLSPRRLEVLELPGTGALGAGDRWRQRGRTLVQAVAGDCPLTITALPVNDDKGRRNALQNLVARLTADFRVDPNS